MSRRGSFETKGKSSKRIVLDWIREIKKEMEIDSVLEVLIDGSESITEEINNYLKAPLEE